VILVPPALLGAILACRPETGFVTADDTAQPPPAPTLPTPGGPGPAGPDASTAGTSFVLGFLEDATASADEWFELWVESPAATRGQLSVGDDAIVLLFEAERGLTPVLLPSPIWVVEPTGSGTIEPVGIRIRTEAPVQLVAVVQREGQTAATRVLPTPELGYRYRAATVPGDAGSPSALVVVAAEDTEVGLRPRVDTLDGRTAGEAYTVALAGGEAHQILARGDLTGTEIVASHPVAVFGGGRDPRIDCDTPSHAWEELPPVARWTTDWIVAPRPTDPPGYAVVVADEDDTGITLDCGPLATLDAGDSLRVPLDGGSRIRANRPVLVMQLTTGGCGGDGLGAPSWQLATPARLHRPDAAVAPLANRPRPFADDPTASESVALFAEDGEVESLDLEKPVALAGPRLRGFVYGVRELDAYGYGLGWDCEGCAAGLRDPATCAP